LLFFCRGSLLERHGSLKLGNVPSASNPRDHNEEGVSSLGPRQRAFVARKGEFMSDVATEILKIISDKMNKNYSVLNLSDPLDELGLDSLQVVELTFVIEEKFDVEIPFNANFDIEAKTVADLIRTVEGLVTAKAGLA
jgi:acyl carrier protein